jgi:hypothetical protein
MVKKNKKIKTSIKPDFLNQSFIYNPIWKSIYQIEDRINNIILNTYYGRIVARCEINDLYAIKIQFKIETEYFEYMLSKRENDYGFSIYSLDDNKMHKFNNIKHQTIENNKLYLYNIYKKIFNVIGI